MDIELVITYGRSQQFTDPAISLLPKNQGRQVKMKKDFSIPYIAFFGRPLDEYLAMFMLTEADLRSGRTLDVASGPSSFRAEAASTHCDIVACDPMYKLSPDEILAYGRASIARGIEDWEKNPNFPMSDDYKAKKYAALEGFVADYAAHRLEGAYVYGELPHLPFADRSFDRVLSANFLFAYAHVDHGGCYDGVEFDLDFHLRAVEEIARISHREVRLVPVEYYAPPSRAHDYRDAVCERLKELGFRCRLQPNELGAVMSCYTHVLVADRT